MAALAELKRGSTHDKVEISWKYVEASRLQGYKYWTALADLVDNSIDANSDKIQIFIKGRIQSQVDELVIVDNGIGMNKETLKESYNLGARTSHLKSDLGKFGVGGTLGSIALGKVKYTFNRNKPNGKIIARKLDLDMCEYEDSFFSVEHVPTQEEITLFDDLVGKKSTGTLIMLKDLDRLIGRRIKPMQDKLKKHFGETYYQHLQGNLSILINNEVDVEPRDPICWFHPKTDKMCSEKVIHEGVTYNIKCVNLLPVPKGEISGTNLVKDQGIYVERNERIILKSCCNGDHFQGFWNREDRHRYFRALISFDSDGDVQMGITTDKSSINIDQSLMDKFQNIINPHAKAAYNAVKAKERSSSIEDRRIDLNSAEDIMNKAIITPKNPHKISDTPVTVTSVEDDVEKNIRHRGEKRKYTISEVNLGGRGMLARVTENNVIEVNLDHPYLVTYYVNSSEETRKAGISWIASLLLSELEVGKYSENGLECSMEDFFARFERRLATWCRLS